MVAAACAATPVGGRLVEPHMMEEEGPELCISASDPQPFRSCD